MDIKKLVTAQQACKELGVFKPSVRHWMKKLGIEVKHYQEFGTKKIFMISRADVEKIRAARNASNIKLDNKFYKLKDKGVNDEKSKNS